MTSRWVLEALEASVELLLSRQCSECCCRISESEERGGESAVGW